MKIFLPLLLLILPGLKLNGQGSESEPNNSFNTGNYISHDSTRTGNVNSLSDGTDYFKTLLPSDGTVTLYISATNKGSTAGYVYMYNYDGRKVGGQLSGKYIAGGSNVGAGITVLDTIRLYGRAADSFYIRLDASGSFNYTIRYTMADTSLNDAEPNNLISEALMINELQEKVGHINYAAAGVPDAADYYKTKLPKDGTLKIYVKGTNMSGTSAYLYMYGYDGRRLSGQVIGKYITGNSNIKAGATIYDTLYLHGRAVDTFFFLMSGSGAFQYAFHYEMTDTSVNDAEPNNLISQALMINELQEKVGHVNYMSKGLPDQQDYYRTMIPVDGTMKIYVKGTNMSGTSAYLYLYGYDGRGLGGQVLGKYITGSSNISAGATIYDTIYLRGRGVDTFFFRMDGSGAFTYTLKYEMTDTSLNDIEPNGTVVQAIPVKPMEEKSGHINYVSKGVSEQPDFYKTMLPSDGTVRVFVRGTNMSNSSGYLYFYAYDGRKLGGQVMSRYISNNSNISAGVTIYDTINIFCRSTDSFYFRIEGSQAFKYSFHYDMVNTSANDAEPNSGFTNPVLTGIGARQEGHIGYLTAGKEDSDDYYKMIVPAKGAIRLITEVVNTGSTNGYVYLYAYDKRKGSGQVMAKYIKGVSSLTPGITYRDTIAVNCFNSDTFYLRWTSSGCFKYSFTSDFEDRQPVASTENERIGNTVGFRPNIRNADKFIWSFGDATTSTLKFPLKTFKIGVYKTRLIVTNSICNYKDTAEESFEIKGVEYYTPDSSGIGGDAIMNIFGGGLDTATKIILRQGSTELTPVRKFSRKNGAQLEVIFDLHLVPPGQYDVLITIPGEPEVVYTNGFRVGKFRYPYTWSEVVAPARWRTNVDNKFKLVIGNTGNVMASGVLVAFIWPKSVDMKFDTKWFKPPTSGNYTIQAGDTTFNFKWENIRHFYTDSLKTISPISNFNGKPYDGYMRLILVPRIGAGSTYEIPLIARSSSVAAQNFITYTFKPNIFGSCGNGSWMDVSENLAVESVDLLDKAVSTNPVLEKSPVGWLTKATKGTTKHMANLGQAMGAFYNYLDGTTNSIAESLPADYMQNVDAGNAQVAQAVLDVAVDKLVEKGADGIMSQQTNDLNNWMANNPNASMKSFEFAADNLNDINDIRNAVKDMYKTAKDLKDLNEKLARLDQLLKDCPELKEQVDDLKKQLDKDMNLKDPKETKTNSVTSLDPNAIYGPVGQGANNQFLNRIDRQNFLVTFENVDTAQASAQIVTVLDTLDKTRFDLSTFEFTGYFIGRRNFSVPSGRKQFVFEDSLNPLMRVRVNAQLDTVKGIVTWQFTAIDASTGDIPVFEGFLPPNISKPEGEGGVSYTVQPWSTLKDGITISNRAAIIFDNNAPIATNTWLNTVDILPPTSTLTAAKGNEPGMLHLKFSGSDASSGIGYYNLYVRIDNGSWLAFGGTSTDTLNIRAEYGHKYSFCAVASDRVGNLEDKALTEEATVDITQVSVMMGKLKLQPNPVNQTVMIKGLSGYASYRVTDISGRVVQTGKVQDENEQIDMSALRTGMYIITVIGDTVESLKLLKI